MVRRKKTSIFLDAKESTTVSELKKMVRGITKRAVEDMKFYKDEQVSAEDIVSAFFPETFCGLCYQALVLCTVL